MKIVNARLDIVSHKQFPKTELIRLVKNNGVLYIDIENKLSGRGYYIHKDLDTIKKAKRSLSCILSKEVSDEFIKELINCL